MLDLIKEIEASLKNNNLRCALGMALTLPDICGQIEYPLESFVGKRYTDWCEAYLFNQGFHSHVPFTENIPTEKQRAISPEICYKLRCAYLHSGNLELNQKEKDNFPEFRLQISHPEDEGIYSGNSIENRQIAIDGKQIALEGRHITIDIRYLTKVICNAAKEYYNNHGSKDDFQTKHVTIIDISKETEKVNIFYERLNEIVNKENYSHDYNKLTEGAKRLLEDMQNGYVGTNLLTRTNGEIKQEEIDIMTQWFELLYGGFIKID